MSVTVDKGKGIGLLRRLTSMALNWVLQLRSQFIIHYVFVFTFC